MATWLKVQNMRAAQQQQQTNNKSSTNKKLDSLIVMTDYSQCVLMVL